jgi:hypothetical protein
MEIGIEEGWQGLRRDVLLVVSSVVGFSEQASRLGSFTNT